MGEVDETGSGYFSMSDLGISLVEPKGSTTKKLRN